MPLTDKDECNTVGPIVIFDSIVYRLIPIDKASLMTTFELAAKVLAMNISEVIMTLLKLVSPSTNKLQRTCMSLIVSRLSQKMSFVTERDEWRNIFDLDTRTSLMVTGQSKRELEPTVK